jgi:phosphatidylinositol alpha-mannosyltransferase
MPVLPLTVLRYSEAVNVGTFHAYRPSHPAYRYGRALLDFFFRRLHGRIAVSRAAHQLISRCFPGEYEIIPNGIEIARFGEHVAPLSTLRDGRPTILFVGRFNESRKGLGYLLQALPLVQRVVPNVRLVVVGQGEPERWRSRLARLRLDNVYFAGYVSARMLPRYYASCDIFCAPSVGQESFGIVLLEAMAAGRPVVASRIAGYASVVSDGCQGLLVDPAAPHELAQALIRLLQDRGLSERLAELGRRTAAEYDWDRISRRVIRYYEEVAMPERRLMGGVG